MLLGRQDCFRAAAARKCRPMQDFFVPFPGRAISAASTLQCWFIESQDDMESEMQRLKLELKQTMEMYSAACREALLAKKTVRMNPGRSKGGEKWNALVGFHKTSSDKPTFSSLSSNFEETKTKNQKSSLDL